MISVLKIGKVMHILKEIFISSDQKVLAETLVPFLVSINKTNKKRKGEEHGRKSKNKRRNACKKWRN